MRILNLYAGVGGNRYLWQGHEVTAVDRDEKLCALYQSTFPLDEIVCGDAHRYLAMNYKEFDFIWSSPPCQSHSKMAKFTRHTGRKYPDLSLYEEIIFLKHHFAGKWVVENVIPYYSPLIAGRVIDRHLFWSNFRIPDCPELPERPANFWKLKGTAGRNMMETWLGFKIEGNYYLPGANCPLQVLRNCVHPLLGSHILAAATNGSKSVTLQVPELF